jgi:hypothetical protein
MADEGGAREMRAGSEDQQGRDEPKRERTEGRRDEERDR